jgi:RNA polymerase sigma-70 factor (ECF subfamily)
MPREVVNDSGNDFAALVARARSGDTQATDAIFRQCRDYLLLVASREIDVRLKAKLAPSDLVQTTLVRAAENFHQFRGESQEALFGWVRTILRHELGGMTRHYVRARKRDVTREQRYERGSRFDDQATGSAVDRHLTPATEAQLDEEAQLLRQAMLRLTDAYRQVLLMRNWERLSFREIAHRLDRSENAIKKLWARALVALEREISDVERRSRHPTE